MVVTSLEVEETQGLVPLSSIGLIIPTCNAADHWPSLHAALKKQGLENHQILVVDSSSTDGTGRLAEEAGYRVARVSKQDFRHGATRQSALELMPQAEIIVFLTQDAVPCGDRSIANLVAVFADPEVGAAYGRQLPRLQANPIEAHARLFNYPPVSCRRSFESRHELGFRATYFSNSFGAYRRSALEEVGGFPNVIVSEDVSAVARMLLAGWSLVYCADAEVTHSHSMGLVQEFSRYFDIAVHHSRERWIIDKFGRVEGEGARFAKSELRYLRGESAHLIPVAVLKNAVKWLGYRMGLAEKFLPLSAKRLLSAQKSFWAQPQTVSPPKSCSEMEVPKLVETS